MAETDKELEIRIKAADKAFDNNIKFGEAHGQAARGICGCGNEGTCTHGRRWRGSIAWRASVRTAARLAERAGAMDLFYGSMYWLLLALLATVLAPGMAYFSQLAYFDGVHSRALSYTSPFVSETRRSKIAIVIGDICRWLTVLIVVASIGLAIKGGMGFLALMSLISSQAI